MHRKQQQGKVFLLPEVVELVVQFPEVIAVVIHIVILHGDRRHVHHIQLVSELLGKLRLLQG